MPNPRSRRNVAPAPPSRGRPFGGSRRGSITMFIQVIQGQCRNADLLHQLSDEWRDTLGSSASGWLGGTYGVTDDGQFVAVVRFESREAAAANSERPEQG